MCDYVNIGELVSDDSSVVSDQLLFDTYQEGDIGALRLLLSHWTSDPNVLIFDCIESGNARVLAILLEHPDMQLSEGVVILACSRGQVPIVSLILQDKRFDPALIASTCISKMIAGGSTEALIAFLSDSRLTHLLENTLLTLAASRQIGMFVRLITALPFSSVELTVACITDERLLRPALLCARTEHKKDLLENCVRPPSDIETLRLIVQGSGHAVALHLLSLGIRHLEKEVIELALETEQIACGRHCPMTLALESKSEEICLMLVGVADCKHLNDNSIRACEMGYLQCLSQLLPTLIARKDWQTNDSTAHIICTILSSNHESKVLALLDAGYMVDELTLVRCLRHGYHTTVRAICSKQRINLAYNNYELLRAASIFPSSIGYDALFVRSRTRER